MTTPLDTLTQRLEATSGQNSAPSGPRHKPKPEVHHACAV
jgi:hypothetical protein